ncbi:substrate-binding domain-containing protein [Deinococcus sp.]|uniref:substrate-binding domain-containing protein n=1 Tax=Deinococcus sp. TaxID=47478 RepID=UPI0025CEB0C4|nr:substrate-binding domain-containing protein [Deinococcus sp.]
MNAALPALNTVRQRREVARLGPSELARRAGMTRQALHRIEAGVSVPSVMVALHLARALECRVEDLFALESSVVEAKLIGACVPGQRLQLAQIGPDLCAYPLTGSGALGELADALLSEVQLDGRATLEPLTPAPRWQEAAVLYGCDPALELLGRHAAPGRVLLRPAVSEQALAALLRGEAHAAGLHLYDPESGESNVPFVRSALAADPDADTLHLYALWSWEQGLMTAPGNPLGIHALANLGRAGLRLANRPPGAGSRRLLDAGLLEAGLDVSHIVGYDHEYPGPLDQAEAVAHAQADVGLGPRSAAQAYGLSFVPLLRERFDLVVPQAHLSHPSVQALLQAARSPALRSELGALDGYDPELSGTLITTLTPTGRR